MLVQKQLDPETLDGLKGQGKVANLEKSIQSGDPRGYASIICNPRVDMPIYNRLSALLSAGEETKASTPVAKSNTGPSTLQQRKGGKGNKRR
jgi:hypothetical protein